MTTQVSSQVARRPEPVEEAAELRIQAEQAVVVEVNQATGDRVQLPLHLGPASGGATSRACIPRQPTSGTDSFRGGSSSVQN